MSRTSTTNTSSSSGKRMAIGADLSPLGFHATRAKVSPPTRTEVEQSLRTLHKFIDSNKRRFTAADAETELLEYYHPETLLEILAAREYFASVNNDADS